MKTIKDKVEALLKRTDETGIISRNNDNFLIMAYIREYHEDLHAEFNGWTSNKDLCLWAKKLPSLSEIKRIRADFQNNKGLYLADSEKRKKQETTQKEVIIIAIIIFSCMEFLIWSLYIVTSNIDLDSNMSVNMDDNTLEAIKVLQELQETQYKYNCDIKLINQSRDYEQEIYNIILNKEELYK